MASNLSACEILHLGDNTRNPPTVNKYWPYILGTSIGVASACLLNFLTLRPVMSGIQKHIGFAGVLCVSFDYLHKRREEYYAERDAVFKHYIELHPEDFVEPPRKKIGDMFEPWIPVR